MEELRLSDIDNENWLKVFCLNPGTEGQEYVASNGLSLCQCHYEKTWIVKAIEYQQNIVGFAMYGYDSDIEGYELCRFMIDQKYQNNGIGSKSLKLIVDTMFKVFNCDKVYLSTSPKNSRGIHVYTSFGFVDTGKQCGDEDDIEEVYVFKKEE